MNLIAPAILLISLSFSAMAHNYSTPMRQAHDSVLHKMRAVRTGEQKKIVALFQNPAIHTRLDKMTYAYASCFEINEPHKYLNWKIIKAIAFGESKFNPLAGACRVPRSERENGWLIDEELRGQNSSACRSRYQGLFQISLDYCKGSFANFARSRAVRSERPTIPANFAVDCENKRYDIDVNTLAASYHLSKYAQWIENACPNASLEDFISMLYIGHNDGVGVLRNVILKRQRCETRSIRSALVGYYTRNSTLSVAQGLRKFEYARNVIIPHAIDDLRAQEKFIEIPSEIKSVICPISQGQKLFPLVDRYSEVFGLL